MAANLLRLRLQPREGRRLEAGLGEDPRHHGRADHSLAPPGARGQVSQVQHGRQFDVSGTFWL